MVPIIADRVIEPNGRNIPYVEVTGGTPDRFIIHETANTDPDADAIMHNIYVRRGGGYESPKKPGVSFNYVVDRFRAVQNLPERNASYNAGDGGGPGNYDSESFEFCVNMMKDPVNRQARFLQVLRNGAQLVAARMHRWGYTVADMWRVEQHNARSSYGKDCPHYMRMNGGTLWKLLLQMIEGELKKLKSPIAPPPPEAPAQEPTPYVTIPGSKYPTGGGFLDFWKANGRIPIFGLPISPEIQGYKLEDGNLYTLQKFERAWLHWRPGESVGIVRLGVLYNEAIGEAA